MEADGWPECGEYRTGFEAIVPAGTLECAAPENHLLRSRTLHRAGMRRHRVRALHDVFPQPGAVGKDPQVVANRYSDPKEAVAIGSMPMQCSVRNTTNAQKPAGANRVFRTEQGLSQVVAERRSQIVVPYGTTQKCKCQSMPRRCAVRNKGLEPDALAGLRSRCTRRSFSKDAR